MLARGRGDEAGAARQSGVRRAGADAVGSSWKRRLRDDLPRHAEAIVAWLAASADALGRWLDEDARAPGDDQPAAETPGAARRPAPPGRDRRLYRRRGRPLGHRHAGRAASSCRSARTCNISASTARWSADWSGSSSSPCRGPSAAEAAAAAVPSFAEGVPVGPDGVRNAGWTGARSTLSFLQPNFRRGGGRHPIRPYGPPSPLRGEGGRATARTA